MTTSNEDTNNTENEVWQSCIRTAFASGNLEFFEFMRWVHARRVLAKYDRLCFEAALGAYDVQKTVGD